MPPHGTMSGGRRTALHVLLGVTHVLLGVALLLPVAALIGFASPRALASLPLPIALVIIALVAFPMWVLLMGARVFWRLTPGAVRALRWTHGIVVAGALLLGLSGLLMLQAAQRSAERGGGLLGAVGLLPLILGALVVGLALAALGLLRAVTRRESKPTLGRRTVHIAAHRGGAALWPENSLAAFRGALALGADFLELDVHLTADGEVVVIHDPTLDRTTTATGPVAAVRLADLAGARLRDRHGAATQEPVPTLAQVVDLLHPASAALLLEIKVDATGRPYAGIEDAVLAGVRDLRDRVVVMAFEAETLGRVRAREATIRTALLVGRARGRPADVVREALGVGATHLGVDHRAVDGGLVAAARRVGLRLAAWTVNDDADIRRILELGVDVIISDRPDLALRLAGREPRKP